MNLRLLPADQVVETLGHPISDYQRKARLQYRAVAHKQVLQPVSARSQNSLNGSLVRCALEDFLEDAKVVYPQHNDGDERLQLRH